MKLKHRKNKGSGDDNLIPLINVVFLMLIFFLAAAALRPFSQEGVKPASASIAGPAERPVGPVLVGGSGQITVKGVELDPENLVDLFRQRLASGENKPLPIVADKNLPARKLVEIIESAKLAGIQKIRLVTKRRKER